MSSLRCSPPAPILEYIEGVESGEIVACNDQHALCSYMRRIWASEELEFREPMFADFCKAAPMFFDALLPWERFITAAVCTYDAEGEPRWDDFMVFVGRGAGKDAFIAFLSACLSSRKHGIDNYDVDICANTEDQAKQPFEDFWEILEADTHGGAALSWDWNRVVIRNKATKSRIRYRTNSPKSRDGMRSGACIFNEIHAYENYANITVFTTGMGKVPHGRRFFISSNGNIRDGVFDKYKEQGHGILYDGEPDGGMLPFFCSLDSYAEIDDEAMWAKANPSLPYMPSLMRKMRKEYANWKRFPAENPDFVTKRMMLNPQLADFAVTSWDNLVAASRPIDIGLLRGASCVAGIDFARTTDFVSAGLLFRIDGEYAWLSHHWWCASSHDAGHVKAPLREWDEAGLITIIDESEVDPEIPVRWLRDTAEAVGAFIEAAAMDDYRYTIMRRAISDTLGLSVEDKTVHKVKASDQMRVSPIIDRAFANRCIAWGENPAMRWFTNNAKLSPVSGRSDNYRYDKQEPKSRKTDGFMAMVAAFSIEEMLPDDGGNIYYFEPITA